MSYSSIGGNVGNQRLKIVCLTILNWRFSLKLPVHRLVQSHLKVDLSCLSNCVSLPVSTITEMAVCLMSVWALQIMQMVFSEKINQILIWELWSSSTFRPLAAQYDIFSEKTYICELDNVNVEPQLTIGIFVFYRERYWWERKKVKSWRSQRKTPHPR